MNTWAGIVRVSHMGARQEDAEDFHAAKDQVAAIEGAVPAQDRLHLLPPELNTSGGLPLEKRPSLREAVEGVESGRFAGIIVAYLSRLGRSVSHQLEAWDRVDKAGGRIIVVQEGIDTSTSSGRLHRNILLSIAQSERENHAERFAALRGWATDAGIWQRRQTPLGYRCDPSTRKLAPDDQAGAVAEAFTERAAGASISSIAQRLGMTTSGARYLLSNRVYLGELRVGQHVNPSAHPPLVDGETFAAAQRSAPRPGRGPTKAPALLAGLVRCAGCGHVMSRTVTKVVGYSCARRHSGCVCPAPAAITGALLDDHVERIALVELARLTTASSVGQSLEKARARHAAAEQELAAYLDAVSAADVGRDAFAAGGRSRRAEVTAAADDLDVHLKRQPVALAGPDAWQHLDAQDRNTLLRSLIGAVVVQRAGGRGRVVPLESRVRVLALGAATLPVKRGGEPLGIVPIEVPDADDPRVLRVLAR